MNNTNADQDALVRHIQNTMVSTLAGIGGIAAKLIIILSAITIIARFVNPDSLQDHRIFWAIRILIGYVILSGIILWWEKNRSILRALGWREIFVHERMWAKIRWLHFRLIVLEKIASAGQTIANLMPSSIAYALFTEQLSRLHIKWLNMSLVLLDNKNSIQSYLFEHHIIEEDEFIDDTEIRQRINKVLASLHTLLEDIANVKRKWHQLTPKDMSSAIDDILRESRNSTTVPFRRSL